MQLKVTQATQPKSLYLPSCWSVPMSLDVLVSFGQIIFVTRNWRHFCWTMLYSESHMDIHLKNRCFGVLTLPICLHFKVCMFLRKHCQISFSHVLSLLLYWLNTYKYHIFKEIYYFVAKLMTFEWFTQLCCSNLGICCSFLGSTGSHIQFWMNASSLSTSVGIRQCNV